MKDFSLCVHIVRLVVSCLDVFALFAKLIVKLTKTIKRSFRQPCRHTLVRNEPHGEKCCFHKTRRITNGTQIFQRNENHFFDFFC